MNYEPSQDCAIAALVPHWLLESHVTSGATVLYMALQYLGFPNRTIADSDKHDDVTVCASRKEIAAVIGMSADRQLRHLNELQAVGAVSVQTVGLKDGSLGPNRYTVHLNEPRFESATSRASVSNPKALRVAGEYGYSCAYCGIDLTRTTLTVDHVIPRCKGGSDALENLRPACQSCNSSKGSLLVEEWASA